MMTETNIEALKSGLAQFCSTENYYRHWTGRLMHTDGVQFLTERAGAHWLIDLIASYQGEKALNPQRLQEFQVWVLVTNAGHCLSEKQPETYGVAMCFDDLPGKCVIRQEIEYTDFPLPKVKLYVESGVLLLPSEH